MRLFREFLQNTSQSHAVAEHKHNTQDKKCRRQRSSWMVFKCEEMLTKIEMEANEIRRIFPTSLMASRRLLPPGRFVLRKSNQFKTSEWCQNLGLIWWIVVFLAKVSCKGFFWHTTHATGTSLTNSIGRVSSARGTPVPLALNLWNATVCTGIRTSWEPRCPVRADFPKDTKSTRQHSCSTLLFFLIVRSSRSRNEMRWPSPEWVCASRPELQCESLCFVPVGGEMAPGLGRNFGSRNTNKGSHSCEILVF